MKIAICYSGQLRNMRMMLNTHIEYLLIPLIENKYIIDIYLVSDYNNTTRLRHNNDIIWKINEIKQELFNYFNNSLKHYSNNINIKILTNNECVYDGNNYNENIYSQLYKFYNVLKIIDGEYNYIIRLRPDIYFNKPINIDLINKEHNILYQNREHEHYAGDAIQIFHFKYLNEILQNTYKTLKLIKNTENKYIYESILNNIFTDSKLSLIWIENFVFRWYAQNAIYFKFINIKYFEDWINIEYNFNFNQDLIIKLLNIKQKINNILIYDIENSILKTDNNIIINNDEIDFNILNSNKLYINSLNPDIITNNSNNNSDYNNFIFKDIIGLIPCSGTATRINNIPKFLLPCKEGNLINNTINIFKNNNIENIYISVSNENKHHISKINEYDNNIKYIIRDTNTMSETIHNLINIKSHKYIVIMPDTYFISNNNTFSDITKLNILLNKFKIVVILWTIKETQYGKLGQININNNKVIDIIDKDKDCRYPYSWGIIGWTYDVNHLINPHTPHIGYIINEALKQNIDVGYIISETEYFDCGTSDEYFSMIKKYT
jgi:hypothetical protein